ncbi:MAG TPA: hypothetical protein VJC07_01355 [Candidatus Nanoarchaeia archaeon]|nr:hypothetical protein [Candidatus Nanoarchaeia archaeon]
MAGEKTMIRIERQNGLELPIYYAPAKAEIHRRQTTYIEVWVGLPPVRFEDAEQRNGKPALSYRDDRRNYIWVHNSAVLALQDDPTAFLAVSRRIHPDGRVDAWSVSPLLEMHPRGDIDDILEHIVACNTNSYFAAGLKPQK